jgi:zinc ribbon protein
MAKCPGCGNDVAPGARFCPSCGRAAASPPGAAPSAVAAVETADGAGRRKVIYASIAGLALVLLGVFLLVRARSGVLSAGQPESKAVGVLSAPTIPAPPPAPVLAAPEPQAPSAPVLQAPEATPIPMPADVIGYLRWLKKFEAYRRDLEYRGMAELAVFTQKMTTGALEGLLQADPTGDAPPPRPQDNPVVGIGKVIQDWNRAAQQFQQVRPPDPCAALAGHYNQALTAGVARMSAIQGTLTGALQSMQGAGGQATAASKDALAELYKQRSTREGSVDVDAAYANANEALDQIRSQYTTMPDDVRSFDIKSGGGGMSLPFPGM